MEKTDRQRGMTMEKLLEGMQAAARHAGHIMLEAEEIERAVHNKEGHGNFVTEYDQRVQKALFEELGALLPDAHFIGEEEGQDRFVDDDRKGWAFCIDPIDGTTNFIKGYRPSVTSIGLLRDGKPFMGVVYCPYWDEMFVGWQGHGAFRNGTRIVSSDHPLEESLVLLGTSPYHPQIAEKTMMLGAQYLRRALDLRRSGSAAWDLCSVASGTAGLFFEMHLGLWDFAAGAVIAEEAGCVITDMVGNPLTYDGPSSVLCASRGVAGGEYLPK